MSRWRGVFSSQRALPARRAWRTVSDSSIAASDGGRPARYSRTSRSRSPKSSDDRVALVAQRGDEVDRGARARSAGVERGATRAARRGGGSGRRSATPGRSRGASAPTAWPTGASCPSEPRRRRRWAPRPMRRRRRRGDLSLGRHERRGRGVSAVRADEGRQVVGLRATASTCSRRAMNALAAVAGMAADEAQAPHPDHRAALQPPRQEQRAEPGDGHDALGAPAARGPGRAGRRRRRTRAAPGGAAARWWPGPAGGRPRRTRRAGAGRRRTSSSGRPRPARWPAGGRPAPPCRSRAPRAGRPC